MSQDYEDLISAFAHLSESIDELRAEHHDAKRQIKEDMRTWMDTNLALMEVLREISEVVRDSEKNHNESSHSLMKSIETSQQLAVTVIELRKTSNELGHYLKTDQERQLNMIQKSTTSVQDQLKKMKRFGGEISSTNSSLLDSLWYTGIGAIASSAMYLSIWHFGGLHNSLSNVEARTGWSMIKLERIERALGLN